MVNNSTSINLLKKKENNTLDTFIHFAFTGGRFIVLLTETIALVAFLYRFTIDRQIIDTRDEIKANQTIVKQYEPLEIKYRNLQERLKHASQLAEEENSIPNQLTQIVRKKGDSLILTSIFVSKNIIRIEADTNSVSSLTNFVSILRNDTSIEDVSIDKIENRTISGLISVTISAHQKGAQKEKKIIRRETENL